jgi:hypothetical protein
MGTKLRAGSLAVIGVLVSAWAAAQNPTPAAPNSAAEFSKKARTPNPSIPEGVENELPPHAKVLRVQGDRAIVRLSNDLVVQVGDVLILDLNWDFKKKELESKLKGQKMAAMNPVLVPENRNQSLSALGSLSYSRQQVSSGDPLISATSQFDFLDYRFAARWMWNHGSFEWGPELSTLRTNSFNQESFELESSTAWQVGLNVEYNFIPNRSEKSFLPSVVVGSSWQRTHGASGSSTSQTSSHWNLNGGLGLKIFALSPQTALRVDLLYQMGLTDPLTHSGVVQIGVQSYF